MNTKHSIIVAASLLCWTLTGCMRQATSIAESAVTPIHAPTAAAATVTAPEGAAPQEVAKAFYTWYCSILHETFRSGQPLAHETVAATGYLTQELLDQIQRDREAMRHGPGGADPILCAQDVPTEIEATLIEQTDERARVAMTSDLIGHAWTVEPRLVDGGWRLVSIQCSGPQAGSGFQDVVIDIEPAIEDWHVYANTKFGFDLSLPPDWTYQEHLASRDQPPIGPASVRLFTLIMPQTWADEMARRQGPPDPNAPVIAPFTLELVEGDETVLRQTYAAPMQSESITLNGYRATREVEQFAESLSITRYIVQHPQDAQRWLVFTDPISGFADRMQGNVETVDLLHQVMNTLRCH